MTSDPNVTFAVPDMSCGHCEKAIRKALSETLPNSPVEVDLAAHQVAVAGDAAQAEAAIRSAGYTPERLA